MTARPGIRSERSIRNADASRRKHCQRCHTRRAPAYICVACSNYLAEQSRREIKVRSNEDGTLDEIVSRGFSLEQMSHNQWWMKVGPIVVWFTTKSQTITVSAHEESMGDPRNR